MTGTERPLAGRVAPVAGATRGAGRGIAWELGAAGATVYVTGRSTRERRSEYNRPETIEDTADLVRAAGGYSYDNFEHGPEWQVSGYGPGKLGLPRNVESSNSFSVSVEIPVSAISAAVGFDVTDSVAYTATFEFEMPTEPRGCDQAGLPAIRLLLDESATCGPTARWR